MKRIISLLTLLVLCLTFFGCEENEQTVQNNSASESVEAINDQDDFITEEDAYIYGKIIEKIEPNILQIEPGNVRFKNEYGEKVDIVTYSERPEDYIAAALAPAEVISVTMTAERACRVQVAPDQLSLAIGKEGQNARLAARLTGYKIDIKAD